MYYIIATVAVLLCVCLLLAGCEKKDDADKVRVDSSELTFSHKESREFNISCTDEWHIEADGLDRYYGGNMADVRDFTIEPASGMGTTKVTITLRDEPAENYDVVLKIIGKNNQATLKLIALANN